MKKILSVILLSFLILGLCACGSGGDAAKKDKPLTSEQIVQKLKDDYSLPITQELTYTEETDGNGLLGRPDQYTSKTSWNDENDVDEVQMCNDYPDNGDSDLGGSNNRDHRNEKITIRRQAVPGMGHIRGDAVLNLRVA